MRNAEEFSEEDHALEKKIKAMTTKEYIEYLCSSSDEAIEKHMRYHNIEPSKGEFDVKKVIQEIAQREALKKVTAKK